MAFIEQRLPDCIAFGATFGPEYQTNVVVVNSGHENRNINWAKARLVANIGYRNKPEADTQALIAWFRSMKGRAHGFRVRDWSDYKVDAQTGMLKALPSQPDVYQLCKAYAVAGTAAQELRPINKPVAATVKLFDASNVEIPVGDYSLDSSTGIVTVGTPPTVLPVSAVDLASFRTLVDVVIPGLSVGSSVSFSSMVGAVELEGGSTTVTAITAGGFYCNIDPSTYGDFVGGDCTATGAPAPLADVELDIYTTVVVLDAPPPPAGTVVSFSGLTGATELNGQSATVQASEAGLSGNIILVQTSHAVSDWVSDGVVSVGGSPIGNVLDLSPIHAPVVTLSAPHDLAFSLTSPLTMLFTGVGGAVELNGTQMAFAYGSNKLVVASVESSSVGPYTNGGTASLQSSLTPITAIRKNKYAIGLILPVAHGITVGQTVQMGSDFVGATELNGMAKPCVSLVGTQQVIVETEPTKPSPYVSGGSVLLSDGPSAPAPVPAYWVGEFDVPVRFDVDRLELEVSDRSAQGLVYSWPSIPLIELRG